MSRAAATDVDGPNRRESDAVGRARPRRRRSKPKFDTLSWQILSLAEMDIPRADFLARVARVIAAHTGVPSVEVCLREKRLCVRACSNGSAPRFCNAEVVAADGSRSQVVRPMCGMLLGQQIAPEHISPGGSLMVSAEAARVRPTDQRVGELVLELGEGIKTALLVPFAPQSGVTGLLTMRSRRRKKPLPLEVESYESIAHLIGVAIAQRSSQRALRERVKQLTYLYRIAELFARPDTRVEEITQQSPQLIAHGCPVPGPVTARVRVGELEGWWPKRTACAAGLASEIVIQGRVRGRVEVRCGDWRPEHAEEWERDEAQRFLDAVAGALATALHRSELRSERDALQAQVQHAERMATIGTLMAVLAHEVSSPLVSIHGFAELMQNDPSISGSARADLDRILAASRHVKGVVRKLLSFSSASEPSWQPTNLNHAVEDALSFIEPSCARAGVKVVRRMDLELGAVVADHHQLCQIVVNLAMNAVHAMPDGGVLTLATTLGSKGCVLIVEDTGVGMSPEVQQKMFQPFFTTRERDRGLGMGLAVVRDIVRLHDGTVEVDSELGRGTKMTVTLPMRPIASVDNPIPDAEDAG